MYMWELSAVDATAAVCDLRITEWGRWKDQGVSTLGSQLDASGQVRRHLTEGKAARSGVSFPGPSGCRVLEAHCRGKLGRGHSYGKGPASSGAGWGVLAPLCRPGAAAAGTPSHRSGGGTWIPSPPLREWGAPDSVSGCTTGGTWGIRTKGSSASLGSRTAFRSAAPGRKSPRLSFLARKRGAGRAVPPGGRLRERTSPRDLPGPTVTSVPSPLQVLTDEQKFRIQAMKPMTKEEWDARQSVIRKVVDPETGRTRLIKGDGEVLEEIVTKERHREINKQATRGDGLAFQMRAGLPP
ncbi:ADP-ribosylation factor-like protein 6-interacting protein 4 [Pteropus vampyrus]|uniref:ADP-ribosylation factor-like protein 6-interacting protein 4 n=1 Tax=Pteropus vampyrus TaxID=132908 RepID=A0A6P6C949_PTEVA|nr:ADP-ribosylation factor-like protein 6-interacting protein 4 [Pteropus vampyrus]